MSKKRRSVSGSQKTKSQTDPDVPDQNTENIINDVVRYIILKADENSFYTRSELNQNVIHKKGQCVDSVIQQAIKVLENVYGYTLTEYDDVKMKKKNYFLISMLPSVNYSDEEEECVSSYETGSNVPNAAHKILTLLILSHIFMTNAPVSDKSLYSFLKSLDIDVEVEHPFFGKVKEYIRETLIKNYYLHCEFDEKTKIQTFQWGIRAEIEISKMKVLQFVCEMYGNKQPKDWPEHYRAAENQFKEREELKEETRDESS
ncbi:non-structural maintenance of chromosomes element 3 homolog [Rhynchophorus ferrugineus]|uniref:non-structural maintenance of chromosomes element 3 homolog n=1 Tax=Rhynchophorus ferrugineus TaxID=354439 RepID=UPI003FCCD369